MWCLVFSTKNSPHFFSGRGKTDKIFFFFKNRAKFQKTIKYHCFGIEKLITRIIITKTIFVDFFRSTNKLNDMSSNTTFKIENSKSISCSEHVFSSMPMYKTERVERPINRCLFGFYENTAHELEILDSGFISRVRSVKVLTFFRKLNFLRAFSTRQIFQKTPRFFSEKNVFNTKFPTAATY